MVDSVLRNIHIAAGIAGGWYLLNGLLHDVFVLINHKGGYDRNLLRLLMDGHILIFGGCIFLFLIPLLREGNVWGVSIAIVAAISMLVYCLMIFPFLKSILTMVISSLILLLSILKLNHIS